jgi:serine phosphatase RsbU (regulator of sigma subunit)/Tfp pilus assembly protein PilF
MKLSLRIILTFLFFAFTAAQLRADNRDSLIAELNKAGQDTNRVIILTKLANTVGKGYFKESLAYAREAFELSEKLGFKRGMQKALNITGNLYDDNGDFLTALDYYIKSLRKAEEINDKAAIAAAYNNIGVNYFKLNNLPKALENHLLSVKIKEEINNRKGLSASYNNIGNVYKKMDDLDKALEYYEKSLAIKEEFNDKKGIAFALNNMGNVYHDKQEYEKALDHFKRSLALKRELGETKGVAKCLLNIGDVHRSRKQMNEALRYFHEAYDLATEIGDYDSRDESSEGLALTYKEIGNYQEALKYFEIRMEIRDTLYNRDNAEAIVQMQTLYETEKKEKAIVLLEKDKEVQSAEIRKQQVYIYFYSGGVLLVGAFSFFMFRAYSNKKRLSDLLASQKREVQHQKEIVEEKNREITDSINYAHTIQTALLPSHETMKSVFPQSFVLLKPKDIVSGDFYWIAEKENYSFYVTADCTGHGVPGGFMSMLGTSFLNEIVNERGIIAPAQVLDELRVQLIKALKQKGAAGESKDGMDMTLCRIDKNTMELVYAAANNSLYVLREGTLHEHKPDKQPIGYYTDPKPFTQHTVQLQKEDVLYTFTDGYADQFGGQKGKKFKYKQLQELLVAVHTQPMEKQRDMLNDTLEQWRGDLAQVDDILVVGIKI